MPPTVAGGAPVTSGLGASFDAWSLLHAPLPLGFLSAARLQGLVGGGEGGVGGEGAAMVDPRMAEETLRASMAGELADRMHAAEPTRWADAADASAALDLRGSCATLMAHHRHVLATQLGTYLRAAHSSSVQTARERRAAVDGLMADMDSLDASSAALEAWAQGGDAVIPAAGSKAGSGVAPKAAAAGASKAGFGGGGAAKKSAKKKKR
mmetsp:Transcript_64875/g.177920  ORF Transcript_64875/g.177920 Transcript_64875/m.177920 type:complete len:209 (+) Transcript_64875:229-855(+)